MINKKTAKLFWAKFSRNTITEMNLIPIGWKNVSYMITDNSEKKYVLKIFAPGFLSDDLIKTNIDIINYLGKKLPVLKIIRGLNRTKLQILKHHSTRYQAICSSFDPNETFQERKLNIARIQSMASVLGKIHFWLAKYNIPPKVKKFTPIRILEDMKTRSTLDKIEDYFGEHKDGKKNIDCFIREYLKECDTQIKYFSTVLDDLTIQLVHGDFNLSNIVFDEQNKITTILDFDEICLAPVSFEIARTLVHIDQGLIPLDKLITFFLKYYQEYYRFLTKNDVEALSMFMRYRSVYRMYRYFTYYRFSDKSSERYTNYTKYYRKLNRYKALSL